MAPLALDHSRYFSPCFSADRPHSAFDASIVTFLQLVSSAAVSLMEFLPVEFQRETQRQVLQAPRYRSRVKLLGDGKTFDKNVARD